MSNDNGHHGFTGEEATKTEAGRIRGIILDTIASRVGQVADVHPRLLEGIEVAARRLAKDAPTPKGLAEVRARMDANPEVQEALAQLRAGVPPVTAEQQEYEADPRDCCDLCGGAKRHRAPCVSTREATR